LIDNPFVVLQAGVQGGRSTERSHAAEPRKVPPEQSGDLLRRRPHDDGPAQYA